MTTFNETNHLPEPVDLIVNELIGDFGTDENIVESVGAFAARHLRPGGRILPERLTTWLVPVEYGDEFHGVYRRGFHGLDLSPALEVPATPAAVMFGLRQVPKELAAPRIVEDIRFAGDLAPRVHRIGLDFEITAAGPLQGFVGYFEAVLSGDLTLRNYPCSPGCHWVNWHWPLPPPIQVAPGQRIEAVLEARENMVAAGWFLDWALC